MPFLRTFPISVKVSLSLRAHVVLTSLDLRGLLPTVSSMETTLPIEVILEYADQLADRRIEELGLLQNKELIPRPVDIYAVTLGKYLPVPRPSASVEA